MTAYQSLKEMLFPIKVLISPIKTFKEMAPNPQIKGLIILLALLLGTTAGAQYATASKIFLTINNQPTSLLASNMFTDYILSSLVDMALIFFANWIIYAGALLVLIKAFREKGGPWRPFLTLIGYVFSIFIIRISATAVLISTLPNLLLEISTWPPATQDDFTTYVKQFNEIWAPTLASQVASVLIWIVYGWFVMLGAVGVHTSRQITWRKAIIISVCAYLINFILSSFFRMAL